MKKGLIINKNILSHKVAFCDAVVVLRLWKGYESHETLIVSAIRKSGHYKT